MGRGYGHLTRLYPIAAELLEACHRVIFVARPTDAMKGLLAPLTHPPNELLLETPPSVGMPPADAAAPIATLADLLVGRGLADKDRLAALAIGWQSLFKRHSPDLVVSDFDPACVAFCRGRVPVISVGHGFSIPPAGAALPPIRPWEDDIPDASKEAEARLCEALSVALCPADATVETAAEALRGDHAFPCTLAVLDPYRGRRREPVFAPYNDQAHARPDQNVELPVEFVFVYLPPDHPQLGALAELLSGWERSIVAFVPPDRNGAAPSLGDGILRLESLPALARILPRARCVVHHGGLGIAQAALKAGAPQIMHPAALEQQVTAWCVQRLGCGAIVPAGWRADFGAYTAVLRRAESRAVRHTANAVSGLLPADEANQTISTILGKINRLLCC